MPRMESTDERETISIRLPAELKNQYQEAVDTMSDDLRDYIEGVVGNEDNGQLPDDETLAAGLRTLRRNADPDTGEINAEDAKALVSENAKVPKTSVRRRVLAPLERREYIAVNWGTIILQDPPAMRTDGGPAIPECPSCGEAHATPEEALESCAVGEQGGGDGA